MTSGGTTAFAPSVVPTIILVSGSTMINRIMNGTERKRLMRIPRIF